MGRETDFLSAPMKLRKSIGFYRVGCDVYYNHFDRGYVRAPFVETFPVCFGNGNPFSSYNPTANGTKTQLSIVKRSTLNDRP